MTTKEATRYLGRVLEFGATFASTESEARAERLLDVAVAHAKATNWGRSKSALDAAYRALGATPDPASGYAFYAGRHPIQDAAREAAREFDEWDGPIQQPRANPGPAGPPGGPYDTPHRHFVTVTTAGEADGASIEQMDAARLALASRADRLARKPGSRREVETLRARYDALLGRMVGMGWR